MRINAIKLAERKYAQGQAPVYMYLFAWRSPALGGKLGAPHTVEIPFVFDNTDIPKVMTAGGLDVKALAARTSEAWIQFARSGNPNHEGLPNWPAYTTGERATMVFDNACKVVDDPGSEEEALGKPLNCDQMLLLQLQVIPCRNPGPMLAFCLHREVAQVGTSWNFV